MKAFRKIANPKLYEYLKKYTNDIVDRVITSMKIDFDDKKNKRLYYELEVAYLKDISKLKTFDDMPKKWYKYFEELEIEKTIENEEKEKGVWIMNMKIGNMRVLYIKVVDENNKDISYYEGMVEDAPAEIKEKEYKSIKVGNTTILGIWERKYMVRKIEEQIKNAKDELEVLIFRYGATNEKVIEQNNKIDNLVIEYYNIIRKLKESKKIIKVNFKSKKVV